MNKDESDLKNGKALKDFTSDHSRDVDFLTNFNISYEVFRPKSVLKN